MSLSSADKASLAAAFEAVAAPVVADRGPPVLRAKGNGSTRILRTESGNVVTHGDLMRGLLKKAEIEVQVVDGVRPESVVCRCGEVVFLKSAGPVPAKCKRCYARARQRTRRHGSVETRKATEAGASIRAARTALGYTMRRVADALGIRKTTYSQWEYGYIIPIDKVAPLADALRLDQARLGDAIRRDRGESSSLKRRAAWELRKERERSNPCANCGVAIGDAPRNRSGPGKYAHRVCPTAE